MSPCYEGTYAMAKGSPERIISYLLAYFTWSPGDITQKATAENVKVNSENNKLGMFLPAFSSLASEILVSSRVETLGNVRTSTVATNRAEITKNKDSICQ